ncbi:hypothetical protein P168DRAFT_304229 [Aspergillus campestris IBT 28561]|uniref:GPI anchored protein n=1 Tax=Aspergillus campestris (strain IBT 28561) TaxID=1392248 RepID=A0A2I1D5P8_ASPC2|nr:uncharacterized protein P168DRAFT_304229 [Aspergillus campestris IBT 28561]PKY05183.1 hypothetical protein P168DRAFT_304229 [Aspergillus campestris IBT 28561]
MQYKSLCFLLSVVASAVAEPKLEKRGSGDDAYSAAMASLESNTDLAKMATATEFEMPTDMPTEMPGDFKMPPSSIISVLMTAVPPSFYSQMGDPDARSSVFNDIHDGHYPDWYNELPNSVKTYISTAYQTDALSKPTGGFTTTGSSSSETGPSSSSKEDSSSGSSTGSDSKSSSPSATSESIAAPTGALAAGLAGVAGVLGLAIVL